MLLVIATYNIASVSGNDTHWGQAAGTRVYLQPPQQQQQRLERYCDSKSAILSHAIMM